MYLAQHAHIIFIVSVSSCFLDNLFAASLLLPFQLWPIYFVSCRLIRPQQVREESQWAQGSATNTEESDE